MARPTKYDEVMHVVLTVRIEPSVKEELVRLAEEVDMSLADFVRDILSEEISRIASKSNR